MFKIDISHLIAGWCKFEYDSENLGTWSLKDGFFLIIDYYNYIVVQMVGSFKYFLKDLSNYYLYFIATKV